MSGKTIWDAMGEIDGILIEETGKLLMGEDEPGRGRRFASRRRQGVGIAMRIGTMAAMAGLVIFLGVNYRSMPERSANQIVKREFLVRRGASPARLENHGEMDAEENMRTNADENMEPEEKKSNHQDAMSSSKSKEDEGVGMSVSAYEKSLREVLQSHVGENVVYSPVNLYLAMGMLSEMGGGNTQKEILTAMGEKNQDAVREKCQELWSRLCWRGDGFQSVLGQSIWMDEEISYSEEMVETLAEQYFASSFQGTAGEERDQAMEEWLGGFFSPVSRQEREETVSGKTFDVLSATAYGEEWREEEGFDWRGTEKGIFYQIDGAEREVSFLQGEIRRRNVTEAERYCSVDLELAEGSCLSVYLPEEGIGLEELLQRDLKDILSRSGKGDIEGSGENRVAVSLPRFEVTSDISLNGALRGMGVQDAFQERVADFSPLLGEGAEEESRGNASPAVGEIRQNTRVVLDERGCGTEPLNSSGETEGKQEMVEREQREESEIICNRPFLFILWDQGDLPVLAGTISAFGK